MNKSTELTDIILSEAAMSRVEEKDERAENKAPKQFLQSIRAIAYDIEKNKGNPEKSASSFTKLREYYWSKKHWDYRSEIGDVLAECGFPSAAFIVLENLKSRGYFAEGLEKLKYPNLWKTSFVVFDNLWNYSDASSSLARALAKSKIMELLCQNLTKYKLRKPDTKSNLYFIQKASLSIINNIARRPENKEKFKAIGASKIVFEYKFSHDDYIKILALMTLSYIVDANESKKLTEDEDTIETIIKWMNLSIDCDDTHRINEGFTAAELAFALDKLAIDGNTDKIIEGNALHAFVRMLRQTDREQQINAAKCIWTLAFNPEARRKVKENKKLISELQRLEAEGSDKELLVNVKGALWVLFEKDTSNQVVNFNNPNHLFISYSWNEKETVRRIWQNLREAGYQVWIDIERMSGDILEAMSSAVENSSVVILCVSEAYKQSQCCRTEASYSYKKKKGFIPLFMQKPYDPDGWLGAIVGTKLYFDFSSDNELGFDETMSKLLGELQKFGIQPHTSSTDVSQSLDNLAITNSEEAIERPLRTPIQAQPSPVSLKPLTIQVDNLDEPQPVKVKSESAQSEPVKAKSDSAQRIKSMSKADIVQWLTDNDLKSVVPNFKNVDGESLWQLICTKSEDARFFHQLISSDLGLEGMAVMKFKAVLEKLVDQNK